MAEAARLEDTLVADEAKDRGDVVVSVRSVSKKFCRSLKRSMAYGVVDLTNNLLGIRPDSRLRKYEFWAVEDVSVDLRKGEVLGLIGVNGSGKSTLLRLLTGIFPPDKGEISIKGRVGALVAVGAGFHPHMTGRDNIYLNGTILGMSRREIKLKFDRIVDFAEVGDFIDAPVATYSSGMRVRLGFAIAVHCEPDILLIDEILSVGDLSFRNKSLRFMESYRSRANAIMFVSHNLEHIRVLCDRLVILDKGRTIYEGGVHQGLVEYEELTRRIRVESLKGENTAPETTKIKASLSADETIEVIEMGVLDSSGRKVDSIGMDAPLRVYCDFRAKKFVASLYVSAGVLNEELKPCIWLVSNDNNKAPLTGIKEGTYRIVITIPEHHLIPRVYIPNLAIRNAQTGEHYEKILPDSSFRVVSDGNYLERGIVAVKEKWELIRID